MSTNRVIEIGEPFTSIPDQMYAMRMLDGQLGNREVGPEPAFQKALVDLPPRPGPHQVWVWVMAAGINYNNVLAAINDPINVIPEHRKTWGQEINFHIPGSDGSGIVIAVGEKVTNVKEGDEVVLDCEWYDPDDPTAKLSRLGDRVSAKSYRIWGHSTPWGSLSQVTLVYAHQCHPKPRHMSWQESACFMLVFATIYRMLFGYSPNALKPGEVVLGWGAAGGLGVATMELTKLNGGIPVGVVSSDEKGEFAKQHGAIGFLNRKNYQHWGRMPVIEDAEALRAWQLGTRENRSTYKGLQAFRSDLRKLTGGQEPAIVIEYPGRDTLPTSLTVVEETGMVVICAAMTGYNGDVNLGTLWTGRRRLQGSHFATSEECGMVNDIFTDELLDPCLTRVWEFEKAGAAHQHLYTSDVRGNTAVLVGAKQQ